MTTLLSLPTDILRYHIFTNTSLDAPSLAISSMVCKGIRAFIPADKRKIVIDDAVKHGHLKLAQWLRVNGSPWTYWTCAYAALNGHLEVLQWLRVNDCPWDDTTCEYAAQNGHLQVLQWLRVNRCPWTGWTCAKAALNGHLKVLRWATANGCLWSEETCLSFARHNNHHHIVEWIRAQ